MGLGPPVDLLKGDLSLVAEPVPGGHALLPECIVIYAAPLEDMVGPRS